MINKLLHFQANAFRFCLTLVAHLLSQVKNNID